MSIQNRPIYISQTRSGIFSEDGTVSYQIKTEVIANSQYTGDPNHRVFLLNIFVNTIVDVDDHTQDTFSNYATLADLDLIPNNRESAVNASMNKYRDNINSISFDNLSVATTAAKVVRDTINNIVDTYLRVENDFLGTDTYYLPYDAEVTTLRDEYIQSYVASRDARIAAESAQEESQVAYNNSVVIEEVRAECKKTVCDIADILASAQTLCQLVGSKYRDTLLELITAAVTAENSTVTDIPTLKSWLEDVQFDANNIYHDSELLKAVSSNSGTGLNLLSLILQAATKSAADCSTMGSVLGSARADIISKLSDLNEKQQLKNAAALAEESALGILATYCPNLDPASV